MSFAHAVASRSYKCMRGRQRLDVRDEWWNAGAGGWIYRLISTKTPGAHRSRLRLSLTPCLSGYTPTACPLPSFVPHCASRTGPSSHACACPQRQSSPGPHRTPPLPMHTHPLRQPVRPFSSSCPARRRSPSAYARLYLTVRMSFGLPPSTKFPLHLPSRTSPPRSPPGPIDDRQPHRLHALPLSRCLPAPCVQGGLRCIR